MKVSVVIAAFNAAEFIGRAIESAQSQVPPPAEIIVVDDASIDDTAKVVSLLATEDSSIRLFSLERNSGPSAARNRAIDEATGDWVAILDADDTFAPGRLRALVDIGSKMGAQIVADNILFYDSTLARAVGAGLDQGVYDRPFHITLHDFIAHNVASANKMDWGLLQPLIRRDFLNAHKIRYRTDIRHGEDFHLIVNALIAGAVYICDPSQFYQYTLRNSGMSRTRVDYKTMWVETLRLASVTPFSDDPVLFRLLQRRIAGLKRVDAQYRAGRHLDAREVIALGKVMLANPSVLALLGGRALAFLKRALRKTFFHRYSIKKL